MVKRKPLVGIITGHPHSFTTVVSQLLHCHPNIASGVEFGLLLSKIVDFNEIKPFWDWLIVDQKWGWCLKKEDRNKLLKANNFEHAYESLNEIKGRDQKDISLKSLFKDSDLIFDKTPAYIFILSQVMEKVEVHIVITLKSLNEGIDGLYKRNHSSFTNIFKLFLSYNKVFEQTIYALEKYPERIFIADYKNFCYRTNETMRLISKHFDIEMDDEFSLENYNKRFGDKVGTINNFQRDKIEYKYKKRKFNILKKCFIYFLSSLSKIKLKKIKKISIHNNF